MNAIATRVINGALSIKPLANFAKDRARAMIIRRAQDFDIDWLGEVATLSSRGSSADLHPAWEEERAALCDRTLTYPDYYCTSFHGYDEGNLGWQPALEADVAARSVHARLWPDGNERGDILLRQSYLDVLKARLSPPKEIVDLGCSTGLSTRALQRTYPEAHITGVELSDYFLAVAQYQTRHPAAAHAPMPPNAPAITWRHAAAEATGLATDSADLVSISLVFHELPASAIRAVIAEAHRILRPGGHLAIMEMNPKAEIYKTMPRYVFTLLKSTEPYLDQYFSLDLHQAIIDSGFEPPSETHNSPRHRTVIARKPGQA